MRKKTARKKFSILKFVRGSITISIILLVVIVGSVMLVGGLASKEPAVKSPVTEAIPDPSSLTPQEKKSLQLETLKFKECSETVTLDLLLEHTGSMQNSTPTGESKINRLKQAVLALADKLTDTSVIGIQSFNSREIKEEVPVSYYSEVRDLIPQKINVLVAQGNTPTHDALVFSYDVLRGALPRFPERKFNFIFVSDGHPVPGDGHGGTQDPRDYNPNPVDQIKNLGVEIYALAIYDGSGQADNPNLASLMRSIASRPENYLEARSADDAITILSSITQKICQ